MRHEWLKGCLFGGRHLVFILHWNSVKKGEPERMFRSHIGSLTRWWVDSKTFQEVKVPLGRIFQGYLAFHGNPRATLSQVDKF